MNKLLDNMAMIREFRNPVDNIQLSVDMLRSVVTESDEKIYLDVINRSAIRIENFINSFLISGTRVKWWSEVSSMHQLLNEVLEIVSERITRMRVVVTKEFAAHDNQIVLNKPAMKIALVNIFMNMIDTMPSGKGSLTLKTKIIHDRYVLRIESNGGPVSGLVSAFFLLSSNQVGIYEESEVGSDTAFVLMFEKTP